MDKLTDRVAIYNWKSAFLSEHEQHKRDILDGTLFSPELVVGSDLYPYEMEKLYKKFSKCHRKGCYDKIYADPLLIDYVKPPAIFKPNKKDEL